MFDVVVLSELNGTNITCPMSLLWSPSIIDRQRPALYVCIIAATMHTIFWLQFIFSASVRQKTMQWLYAYLVTDILLLIRFFFLFIVHTTSKECVPSKAWSLFVCYIEATVDNYLNVLEVYILLALNICRYEQIVHNKNVYVTNVRLLIFAHLAIYLMPLILFIILLLVGWAQIERFDTGSCAVAYINVYCQVINIIFGFALPILLNIFVLYYNIRHVHLTSRLRQAQHRVTAREKYNRSLIIQFFVFYTVWLLLWSPNIIIYQFKSGVSNLTTIASLLNYIEITLDPLIIAALDVRFQKLWRTSSVHLRNILFCNRPNQRRIVPITTDVNLIEMKRTPQNNNISGREQGKI
jgi:hypothetical protein